MGSWERPKPYTPKDLALAEEELKIAKEMSARKPDSPDLERDVLTARQEVEKIRVQLGLIEGAGEVT